MRCSQSVIVLHVSLLAGALLSNFAVIAESSSSRAGLRFGSVTWDEQTPEVSTMAKRRIDDPDLDIDGDGDPSQDKVDLHEDAKHGTSSSIGGEIRGVDDDNVQPAASFLQEDAPMQSESVSYVLETLQKFKSFATQNRAGVEERHTAEEKRLRTALQTTKDKGTQVALKHSATSNSQSLLETRRVYNNMINFASSMQRFLSAASSKGRGCSQTKCGLHASCTDTTLGAQCVCNEGYMKTGQDCAPPPEFMPRQLLFEASGSLQTQATAMNVAIFGKNNIAVAFVDLARGRMGRTVVGNVQEAGAASLSPPQAFTMEHGKAYDPVVVGTESRRVFFAWRDARTST
jgi:hypothetical protein